MTVVTKTNKIDESPQQGHRKQVEHPWSNPSCIHNLEKRFAFTYTLKVVRFKKKNDKRFEVKASNKIKDKVSL